MSTSIYDFQDVAVTYGAVPLAGLADGSSVTLNWLGDGDSVAVGGQGDAVVVRDPNRAAEVTVRLQATGPGRNTLSALAALKNIGGDRLPLMIAGPDTGEVFVCTMAAIKQIPPITFGPDEAPVREVVFLCGAGYLQTFPTDGLC